MSRWLCVGTAALIVVASGCRWPDAPLFDGLLDRTEVIMGARLRIALEPPPGRAADAVFAQAFARVRALDDLLSDYRPETPLSRLSATSGGPAVRVTPELRAFLERAQRDHAATEGAFDITAGALVRALRRGEPAAIHRARAATGLEHVLLLRDGRVQLRRPGMWLDAGGIGKGMAVDAVVAVLRAAGVRRAFVDFGGSSFYGLGVPRGRAGWPVLLGGHARAQPLGVVHLRDEGFSSSEARLSAPQGARRRRHILDPRTRTLVDAERYAVVLSPSATDADVLTTALVVEPRLRAKLAARYPGAIGLVVDGAGDPEIDPALAARMTP